MWYVDLYYVNGVWTWKETQEEVKNEDIRWNPGQPHLGSQIYVGLEYISKLGTYGAFDTGENDKIFALCLKVDCN